MLNDVNDLTLRRVPRHDTRYVLDRMNSSTSINTTSAGDSKVANDAAAHLPAPVPAVLAPAQGHAPPKILKRPVSGSFSLNQGHAKVTMYSVANEDVRERSSTIESSMDRSTAASEAQYAYGLSQHQALTSDEYGPITPVQGMSEAFPRMMNECPADQIADMTASPRSTSFR